MFYGSLMVITKKTPIEAMQKIKESNNITTKINKTQRKMAREEKRNKRTVRINIIYIII